jgi:V-type H+-transporting ATPase S1 subunit
MMLYTMILAGMVLVGPSLGMQGKDFFENVDDIGRIQRSLLQAEEGSGEQKVEIAATTTTEEPIDFDDKAGPEIFYFQKEKLPKFLMEVQEGITVSFYDIVENVTKEWDTFVLNEVAKGGISGSRIDLDKDDLRVVIDYKSQSFEGLHNREELRGLMIEMDFDKEGGEWRLIHLEVKSIPYKGDFFDLPMRHQTVHGYDVAAPVGLCFACSHPGNFQSIRTANSTYGGTIKFPGVKLQVFEVHKRKFGPEWECGELITIGLWVGILVTLAFATICFWGFSMLASINTMDRFDDPKGKAIYIPQSD